EHPMPGHPMIPLIQWTSNERIADLYGADLDARAEGSGENWPAALLSLIESLSRGDFTPLSLRGNADFQITRGLLGVSM
ncbi:MAG: hypothetical protein VYB08_05355, partial [Candidatus Latescibacterota bacterium]|nr:hypothetical protein [Candidatus Latescibacterota bacterium]